VDERPGIEIFDAADAQRAFVLRVRQLSLS
jgi:hypothetical protein